MLIILNDPTGVTGRKKVQWDLDVSVQENIARHLPHGGDAEVIFNGERINPAIDPRLDRAPHVDDLVVVSRRPGAIGAAAAWVYYVYAAVAILAIYAIATMPKPNAGAAGATGKDSSNNRLTGQSNIARAYQAVPDVYGYRRVWPDLIQPSTVEYIDHIKYVTEWLCVSRGKGTITDVQYADTPIGDIAGSSFEVFEPVPVDGYPEFGEVTVSDVYETFASDDVNGQELAYAVPFAVVEQSGSYAFSSGVTTLQLAFADGPSLDQLKSLVPGGTAAVQFSAVEAGLPVLVEWTGVVQSFLVSGGTATFTMLGSAWSFTDSGTTSIKVTPNETVKTVVGPFTLPIAAPQIWWNTVFLRGLGGSVSIRAEWWKVDEGGVEVPGTREVQDDTYSDSTFDQRFYTEKVTPAAGSGRYRIQFTRLNPQVNSQGADVAKLEEVYAVRHYASKTLPGATILRVTTKATLDATGFSDRKFNLRWARHVRTLTSDALSASRNFGRIICHIWTLANGGIDEIDTEAIAEINSDLGESSPLLRFDGSLDDADLSLGGRIQLVANMARCTVSRDGTRWTVTRDQRRPYPELQLDYRNLARDGESSIAYSAHLPASHDGVEVEYVDEVTQSKKSYVRLKIESGTPVPGISRNPQKIQLLGCATHEQAENRAGLEARKLLFQRTSVSDSALSDAMCLRLGSTMRWVDPNDFAGDDGLQAGEVMSITGSFIATSEPLDWKEHAAGRIAFTGIDGRPLGPAVTCSRVEGGALLESVPAGLYIADNERQLGSRYAFGVGLTEAEQEAQGLYTVTSIKPAGEGNVSLAFANYDDRIYEGDT